MLALLYLYLYAIGLFLWIFLLPICVIGLLLSVPFFVTCFPVYILITTYLYFCVGHVAHSSIRQMLSKAPFHLWFGNIHVPVPKDRHLICCHPHGMICTTALFGIHLRHDTYIAVTPVLFSVPLIGWAAKYLGAIPATYKDIITGLKTKSVILLPGGVPEIVNNSHYTRRFGFLQCAKQADVPILRVVNNTKYYDIIPLPCLKQRMFIARRFDIPVVFPWIFGWYGTWIPKRKPIEPDVSVFHVNGTLDTCIEEENKRYFNFVV